VKKIVISLVILSLFVISACSFPQGEEKDSSGSVTLDVSKGSTPTSLDLELEENLNIKADIFGGNNKKLKNYSISLKNLEADKIVDNLSKDKKIIENREVQNELFPEFKDKYFSFSDGSYLTIQYQTLRYSDSFYSKREYESVISGSTYFIRNDLKDVFQETTLEGIDKNKAIEEVKNAINDLDISNAGNPDVIALDYKTLESEWEDYETKDGSSPRKFEKEDEAYVVIFPVVLDDTNITNKGYSNAANQMDAMGSRIMGVVGKEGLIFLTVQGIYEIGETLKDKISPISLETALNKVKNKYKDVLITDPMLISKISLEYVPTVSTTDGIKYKLIPAWVFLGKQDLTIDDKKGGSFQVSSEFSIMINAENGEELHSGGER
jgi:hypothetical protein